jgi:hypothetical protein
LAANGGFFAANGGFRIAKGKKPRRGGVKKIAKYFLTGLRSGDSQRHGDPAAQVRASEPGGGWEAVQAGGMALPQRWGFFPQMVVWLPQTMGSRAQNKKTPPERG